MNTKPTRKRHTQKRWTLLEAASETGRSRETIKRGLSKAGEKVDKDGTFSTRQLLSALIDDLKEAKARRERAEAEMAELELQQKRRELIPASEVSAVVNGTLSTLTEAVRAMPSALARRCNPTDPEHARKAIAAYVDGKILARGREHVIKETENE